MTFSIESNSPLLDDSWRGRLASVIEQDPLIRSTPSRPAVKALTDAPRTIYMGVGLCTRTEVTRGLPFDLLGMVLPAEAIRRAVGASQLVVLVADAHAMTNHLPPERVEQRARLTVRALARIARRLSLSRLVVVRASKLAARDDFQRILRAVRRAGEGQYHPYVLQQVADVAYFSRSSGSVVKVGWALGQTARGLNDETRFDRLVAPLSGARAAYVYCWPGRTLDDARGRAPPYIVSDPEKRVLLQTDENVFEKLRRAEGEASRPTVKAVRAQLRRVAASYARLIAPVRGASVEARAQAILETLYRPRNVKSV